MSHPPATDGALSLHALPDESPVEVQFSGTEIGRIVPLNQDGSPA